jgi:hypothetical protein
MSSGKRESTALREDDYKACCARRGCSEHTVWHYHSPVIARRIEF